MVHAEAGIRDPRVAAPAAFPEPPVHPERTSVLEPSDAFAGADVQSQQIGGLGVQEGKGIVVDPGEGYARMHAAEKQHLALVDVADAGRDALIEQHVGDQAVGGTEQASARHQRGRLHRRAQEVRPHGLAKLPAAHGSRRH